MKLSIRILFALSLSVLSGTANVGLASEAIPQPLAIHQELADSASALESVFKTHTSIGLREIESALKSTDAAAIKAGEQFRAQTYRSLGLDPEAGYDPSELYSLHPAIPILNQYVSDGAEDEPFFTQANRQLRKVDPMTPEVQAYVVEMQSALAALPRYEGLSFRGVKLGQRLLKIYVPGQIVTELGFTSTSIQPSIAERFASTYELVGEELQRKAIPPSEGSAILIIKGKSGRPVSFFSFYANELEILFAPSTTFKVIAVTEPDAFGTRYVFMEELTKP